MFKLNKKKQRKKQENLNLIENENQDINRENIIGDIVKRQKSFKTINILENPVSTGNKIGEVIDYFSSEGEMNKIKKFFKWLWYNKEQLLAILYNAVMLGFAEFLMWSKTINDFETLSSTTASSFIACSIRLSKSATPAISNGVPVT